jgi:hypothetical protein
MRHRPLRAAVVSAEVRFPTRIAASAIVSLLLLGCRTPVLLPPASAGPEVVLDAYLRLLVAGDCETGRQLAAATFTKGNGELCGAARVRAYAIEVPPARPSADEVVFGTRLTTTGTADGSVPAGEIIWFYDLRREPGGPWRIAGGGSGP